jgi:hypothetical protein
VLGWKFQLLARLATANPIHVIPIKSLNMKLLLVVVFVLACLPPQTAKAVILVGGAGGTGIQRFDEKTGAWLGPLISNGQHGYNGTSGMVIGADLHLYVAGSDNRGSAKIWRFNLAENRFLGVFASLNRPGDFFDDVDFGPDGNLYVTNTNHGTVTRFDGMTGEWLGDFISGLGEGVEDLEFAPSGELFVSVGPTGMWRFDGTTGAVLGKVRDGVNDFFTFGPDAQLYQTAWSSISRLDPQTGGWIFHGTPIASIPMVLAITTRRLPSHPMAIFIRRTSTTTKCCVSTLRPARLSMLSFRAVWQVWNSHWRSFTLRFPSLPPGHCSAARRFLDRFFSYAGGRA